MPTASPYEQLERWLNDTWIDKGPAACVVDGFSGVGKSRLASAFAASHAARTIFIRATSGLVNFEDLTFELLEEIELIDLRDPPSDSDDFAAIIEHLLRQGVIVVLDNMEELLDQTTGMPPAALVRLVSKVASRPSLQGRLLMISNHALPEGNWRDGVERRTLTPPGQDAAVALLSNLLETTGRQEHVPSTQMGDVVNWLGRIPRAIEVLVACLEVDALDDLIGLEPEAWELRDQIVSKLLTDRLEHRLLARTLARLDSAAIRMLEYASVHRRPFDRDALSGLQHAIGNVESARQALASRFLLAPVSSNRYSLNSVARSIARQRIEDQPRIKVSAHSVAADHYSRHFRFKGRSAGDGLSEPRSTTRVRHGYDFIEARFHLIACGRASDFEPIAARYRYELLRVYRKTFNSPPSPAALNELVLTLLAALDNDDRGYASLRIHLARLLLARDHPRDDVLALRQTRRAIREGISVDGWVLHLRISAQVDGLGAVWAALEQGRNAVSAQSAGPLYVMASKIFSAAGQVSSAIDILKQGMGTPINRGFVFALYQQAAALLSGAGRFQEAISLLRGGISRIGLTGPSYHRLAESALFVAHVRRDRVSLLAVANQIKVEASQLDVPEERRRRAENIGTLAQALLDQCDEQYARVASLPDSRSYPTLACQVSFCQLVTGDPALAQATLDASSAPANEAAEWLRGCIALSNGQGEVAEAAFERALARPLLAEESNDPNLWLRIWDRIPTGGAVHPAFYYPVLPAALTGLPVDLHRKPEGRSVFESWSDNAIRLPLTATRLADKDEIIGAEPRDVLAQSIPDRPTVMNLIQVSPSIGSISAAASTEEHNMSDTYNVNQAGAVGRQSSASGNTFQQVISQGSPASLRELSSELDALRQEMRKQDSDDAEHDVAMGEVAQAKMAAEAGDADAVQTHLSRAGKWALAAANSIGLTLAAAAIKAAIGM